MFIDYYLAIMDAAEWAKSVENFIDTFAPVKDSMGFNVLVDVLGILVTTTMALAFNSGWCMLIACHSVLKLVGLLLVQSFRIYAILPPTQINWTMPKILSTHWLLVWST
jgi:hypothetical protein